MRRHLPRLVLTGALLSPMTLHALGLGEIHLNSALNQPFDAEIELIAPSAEELLGLKVGLASPDLFARQNMERPAYLAGFQFSVRHGRDGSVAIKITSDRSVTEPFVTLLVEASWERGRLVREYTVLLDPPVFMPAEPESSAPPVTTPQSGAQTGRIEREPAPESESEPEPELQAEVTPVPTPEDTVAEETAESQAAAAEAAEPADDVESADDAELVEDIESAEDTESEPAALEPARAADAAPVIAAGDYTVQRNDTLWGIAKRLSDGSPRAVNRTMIALFRANPRAFEGNINRLRSGSVLHMPDLAEIEAIPSAEANAEVVRQVAEWGGAQPAATAEESSRLRLVSPEETPSAEATVATAPAQPASTPAAASSPPGEPKADSRLAVESPDLAGVQQGVTDAQVPAVEQAPPEAQAETEVPAQTAPAQSETAATPSTPKVPRAKRPPRRVVEEAPAPSIMDRIGEFWWVPVALGVLLVFGLIAVVVRRRRESPGASLDSLEPISYEPRMEPVAYAPATKTRDRLSDSFLVEDEPSHGGFEERSASLSRAESAGPKTRPVEPEAAPSPPQAAYSFSEGDAARADQQDALAEADFHMAYGLYDQAADLVKIAIDREPARRDLKLKLLEIYFVWGNKDLFLETARELHASRAQAAPGEWDKAVIMGKQIAPDEPLFKGEAGSPRLDLVDVNLEGGENRVDVDLFAEPGAEKPAALDLQFGSGAHRAPAQNASDLEFLLDEPEHGAEGQPDPLSRTQETPTIESPVLSRAQGLRDKAGSKAGEQTAELALDDLGLDVDESSRLHALADAVPALGDDEMTQLAPSLSSFNRMLELPEDEAKALEDIENTGTIYIDQVDLAGGGDRTVEQRRPDVDSTAAMPTRLSKELDIDLDRLSGERDSPDTMRRRAHAETEDDRFSSDVFTERTSEVPRIDLDVGEPLLAEEREHERTHKLGGGLELSELEPLTMSEIGTKLDLARAYMDMGDPDGARSILEEVLAEGNPAQKQEAQRLMESIR